MIEHESFVGKAAKLLENSTYKRLALCFLFFIVFVFGLAVLLFFSDWLVNYEYYPDDWRVAGILIALLGGSGLLLAIYKK